MTSKSRMLSRMRELCAELGPEDGIDPRELKRQRAKEARKSSHRKTAQLCGQVARTLNLSLGASSDPLLQQMIVESVEAVPDASRLRIGVTAPTSEDVDPSLLLEALERATPWLRAEVASSIHRKRTPELCFTWRTSWER